MLNISFIITLPSLSNLSTKNIIVIKIEKLFKSRVAELSINQSNHSTYQRFVYFLAQFFSKTYRAMTKEMLSPFDVLFFLSKKLYRALQKYMNHFKTLM